MSAADLADTAVLRREVADRLLDRTQAVVGNARTLLPFTSRRRLQAADWTRFGELLLQGLAAAVRDGELDSRSSAAEAMHRMAQQHQLPVTGVFRFASLIERAGLDELAPDEWIGAGSPSWDAVTGAVRQSCFVVLGAFTERLAEEPSHAAMCDRLTTLGSRSSMDTVIDTVLQGARRHTEPVSLLVFDIDGMANINREFGFGVGDRILERIGVQVRRYFRRKDWTFRHGSDSVAVLQSDTSPDRAAELASRVSELLRSRLRFFEHRTAEPIVVSVSAAVVTAFPDATHPVSVGQFRAAADRTLLQAAQRGPGGLASLELRAESGPGGRDREPIAATSGAAS